MKLVSVIIPCYNPEQYIDKCVNSLVNQTLGIENMELIFVNDASTDATYEKLYSWEEKYSDSILVVNCEKNGGVGGARNVGLMYATGDYIGFVDSDDWIEPQMYQKMYEKIISTGADMVLVQSQREDSDGNIVPKRPHIGMMDVLYKVEENGFCDTVDEVWRRLYRRKLIIENEIFFPEKLAYEDEYWGGILKYYVKSWYVIRDVMYHYVINNNSVTVKRGTHHLDLLIIETMLLDELKKRGFYENNKEQIEYEFLLNYYIRTLHRILVLLDELPYEILCEMQREVIRLIPDFEKNPFLNELNHMAHVLLKTVHMKLSREDWERIRLSYLSYIGDKE